MRATLIVATPALTTKEKGSPAQPVIGQSPSALDWTAVLAFVGSVALIVLGTVRPSPVSVRLSVVAIMFGVIGVAFAASDIWRFTSLITLHGARYPEQLEQVTGR